MNNKEKANDTQIGGKFYKGQDIEHWDYAYARGFDCYQYIITKWVERWRDKGGIEDLRKARHAIQKYIEVAEAEEAQKQGLKAGADICPECDTRHGHHIRGCSLIGDATKQYVDQ